MKRLIFALALAALHAAPASADAVDERVAFSGGTVEVMNPAGEIQVEAWDREEIHVTGTLWSGVEELEVAAEGGRAIVKVHIERGQQDIERSDLRIRVPAGSSLEVSGMSSDIRVSGVTGRQRLRTMSGDVTTEALGARIEADTMSGDVEILGAGVDGRFRGASVSGNVLMRGLRGDLEGTSVSGRVRVDDVLVRDGEFSTTSGGVDFSGRLAQSASLTVEVTSGNADIELLGEVDARFDLETFSGRIRNDFGPRPQRTSEYAPGEELRFTEGSGEARVDVSTFSGTIELSRR